MGKTMTIKEISALLGVSEPTIRYYTDIGMIPNMQRSSSNYRVFDEETLEWLKGTIYFRQLGLSLKDIRHYHDLCFSQDPQALWERYELLKEYTLKAEEELKNAEERLQYLRHITERDRQIAEHTLPDSKNPYKKRRNQE